MGEIFKKRVILILAILNILFLLIAVNSCSDAFRQRRLKEKELYNRLSSEEKIEECKKQSSIFEEKLKKIEKELEIGKAALEDEKAALEATKKSLLQEQLVNGSLKSELEKINKLKQALEQDLKEVLLSGKSGVGEKAKR